MILTGPFQLCIFCNSMINCRTPGHPLPMKPKAPCSKLPLPCGQTGQNAPPSVTAARPVSARATAMSSPPAPSGSAPATPSAGLPHSGAPALEPQHRGHRRAGAATRPSPATVPSPAPLRAGGPGSEQRSPPAPGGGAGRPRAARGAGRPRVPPHLVELVLGGDAQLGVYGALQRLDDPVGIHLGLRPPAGSAFPGQQDAEEPPLAPPPPRATSAGPRPPTPPAPLHSHSPVCDSWISGNGRCFTAAAPPSGFGKGSARGGRHLVVRTGVRREGCRGWGLRAAGPWGPPCRCTEWPWRPAAPCTDYL